MLLTGFTLVLAIATVGLVLVTRHGISQARADARAELKILERQVGAGYRPLLVDVPSTAPVSPDMGALYDVTRAEGPNLRVNDPGPVIETKFPGHESKFFDPRTVFVSFEGAMIYISVPLRNVGRGLAVIDGDAVEIAGDHIGPLKY
jgi:hypothetical protein